MLLSGARPKKARTMPTQPVVLVINLARDEARWKRISSVLEGHGFRVARVSAIDARSRHRAIQSRVAASYYSPAMNRNMTPGECACVLSHIAALKRVIRNGYPYAIVMEDDAAMDERFRAFVDGDLERYLTKCDVVKIEGTDLAPRTSLLLDRTAATSLVLPLVPRQGAAAYAVTRRGARKLVNRFSSFSDPLDFMLSFYEVLGCTYGEVRPTLVRQENGQAVATSNLESERVVAYSTHAARRSAFQVAQEKIIHDGWRRILRLMTVGWYALRFRTFFISAR